MQALLKQNAIQLAKFLRFLWQYKNALTADEFRWLRINVWAKYTSAHNAGAPLTAEAGSRGGAGG